MGKRTKVTKKELDPFVNFIRELNKELIYRFGGASGRVDEGNLSYSLYKSLRAAKKARSKGEDFHITWATYALEWISQTHPFVDGNKRTAYVTFRLILLLGDKDFEINYKKAVPYLRKIASRRVKHEEMQRWVEKHVTKEPLPKKYKDVEKFIKMLSLLEE